jgi:hypothetical protein
MDGEKKGRNQRKASPDHRSDRKSGTGVSGDPKKGGRGGKFTWEGADGYTDEDHHLVGKNGGGRNAKKGRDEDVDD